MSDDAVLIARPDLTILDTNVLPWEEHPGKLGVWWKVLARDGNGQPTVSLQWFPADSPDADVPRRYRHLTVHEQALVISGSRTIWEYPDAESAGQRVVLREGHWIDRRPGSIHGFEEPTITPPVGCVFLVWQTKPGLLKGEPGYDAETEFVPFPDERR